MMGAMNRERWSVRAWWTARRTLSLSLDGVVGVVLFTWVVTGLSLSAGLAITLLGIPLLAEEVQSGRVVGAVERVRWCADEWLRAVRTQRSPRH